jgi:hypothetical protein
MKITRTATLVGGVMVYDPPYTDEELRAQALSFQEMLKSRRAPVMKGSDRAFLEGDVIHHGLQGIRRDMAEHMVAEARRAGINITGKVYKGGLADQRGPADPEAWVGSTDDVLAVCKRKKLRCNGIVHYEPPPAPPPPDVPLAPHIVEDLAREYIAEDPDLSRKPIQEIREMVIDKHGTPSKFRNPPKKKSYDDVPDP